MTTTASTRPLALVTGASSGIGFELAEQLAQRGFDLVVSAENGDIARVAEVLRGRSVWVDSVQADLATYEGVEQLYRRVRAVGRPLEAAAINAGVGVFGDFARETALEEEVRLIRLNVESSVHLAKYVAKDMATRGRGRILFTSSIAATMPAPLEAVYGASKAFMLAFSDSLRNELKGSGVTVTAVLPGPTDTPFFERAGMSQTKAAAEESKKNDPADVARQAIEAMFAGKDRVVVASSLATKIQGVVSRFLPEDFKAKQHRRLAEPASASRQHHK